MVVEELAKVLNELQTAGTSVDDALAAAEQRVKLLRAVKGMEKASGESAKPRTRTKKGAADGN